MARQLWLLRHGEAEPHHAAPDAERRLTATGEDEARAAGAVLAGLGVTFEGVYASPKVRALDTARIAAEVLGADAIVHAPLADGFGVDDALALLGGAGRDARLLVVGHNPDLPQVIHDLTGARVDLSTGAVAGVRVRGRTGELVALLRARELAALARG
jgi:phosphohistidine phosphatase